MKIQLDIKNDKVDFILELLKNFSFVKTQTLSTDDAEILKNIAQSVDELNDIKAKKKKSKPLSEILSEC